MTRDPKLTEAELEALAHGRRDLAGEDAACAAEQDEALGAWIEREQQASHDASVALKRAAPELDDLESMIAQAMAKAPPSGETPARAPSPASLWIGAALGATIAVASGVTSILASRDPSSLAHDAWSDASSLARVGIMITTTIDRLVAQLPGGWGAVAAIGLVLFAILALPLRAMIGPLRLRTTGGSALALALAITAASGTARAYELEGEWPERDAQVSVDVDRTPLSEALRRALASSELGLAYTLPEDPLVTLHVREAPLREVLD
nr:hypothetical protein [Myxococcota bacterium]